MCVVYCAYYVVFVSIQCVIMRFPEEHWNSFRNLHEIFGLSSEQEVLSRRMIIYAGLNVLQKMAFASFSRELAPPKWDKTQRLLSPEYVATLMNTDMELRRFFEGLIEVYKYECVDETVDGKNLVRTRLHLESSGPVNSEISVFYRYFISKCHSNLKNTDARSELLENYASIFPFRVDISVNVDSVPILNCFEDAFLVEIRQFIDYHIRDSDFDNLEKMLLKNIEEYKKRNFSKLFPMKYERLRAIAEIGTHELLEEPEEIVGYVCEYMGRVDRLNEAGIDWYMNLQRACNEVNAMYNKNLIPTRGKSYFKYLPEVNCCEMLLLLEYQFYVDKKERYAYLFKKYLFFFGHAVEYMKRIHPLFFIDDALFACLTPLRTYLFSRTNVFKLQYELWMMALVHLRRYTSSTMPMGTIRRRVDKKNLRRTANYVIHKMGSDAYVFDETSLLCPIRHRNFYVRDDTVYKPMFVDVQQLELRHFYELILKAALLPEKIERLVIYNAYTGEEVIISMPPYRYDIRNLIVIMHLEVMDSLRRGPNPLPLRDAVRAAQIFSYHPSEPNKKTVLKNFLIEGKEECVSVPGAVRKEVEFEPFPLRSLLESLSGGQSFTNLSTALQESLSLVTDRKPSHSL